MKYNIKYNLTFSHAFVGDYKTTFALFGETRIGRPYSYTMQDASTNRSPVFGTVQNQSRFLHYVPTGLDDARVSYDSTARRDTLNALIEATGLKKYRGQIAPRNASTQVVHQDRSARRAGAADGLGGCGSRFSAMSRMSRTS